VPVIAADQPIHAVAKPIHWQWPENKSEDKFIIIFGGLHIAMAAHKLLGTLLHGQWLDGSSCRSWSSIPKDSRIISDSVKHHKDMTNATGHSSKFVQASERSLH
jgi:hypothetical protein